VKKDIKISLAPLSRFRPYSSGAPSSSSLTTQASGASGSKPLQIVFENPGKKLQADGYFR
jgi:hypothetical protein